VRTSSGERAVGQVPDVPEAEALAFFTRRFDALQLEVDLLERRMESGTLAPDEAARALHKSRAVLSGAAAVGDLDGLAARLDAVEAGIGAVRQARKAQRAEQLDQAKAEKERMVGEAERLAVGQDWRGGVNRFRSLLDEWKALPRLDRSTDDALWHRFSTARTTYTKRRKAQFAQQAEDRAEAKQVKQRLIREAERLASGLDGGQVDWTGTANAFRDLMAKWKAAGAAPREDEERLWQEFRGHQDRFFAQRQEIHDTQNAEQAANAQAKRDLLAEWEPKIVPVADLGRSRAAYRSLLEQWAAIGRVPRDAMRTLDNRLRALEQAVAKAEERTWQRTNPEARQRAEGTAAKLRDQIAVEEGNAAQADARGDASAARKAREAAETYRSWLVQAENAAAEFSG